MKLGMRWMVGLMVLVGMLMQFHPLFADSAAAGLDLSLTILETPPSLNVTLGSDLVQWINDAQKLILQNRSATTSISDANWNRYSIVTININLDTGGALANLYIYTDHTGVAGNAESGYTGLSGSDQGALIAYLTSTTNASSIGSFDGIFDGMWNPAGYVRLIQSKTVPWSAKIPIRAYCDLDASASGLSGMTVPTFSVNTVTQNAIDSRWVWVKDRRPSQNAYLTASRLSEGLIGPYPNVRVYLRFLADPIVAGSYATTIYFRLSDQQ